MNVILTASGAEDVHRLNFRWLLALRWVAFVGQAVTALVAEAILHIGLPLVPLFALIAAELLSNVACAVWLRRQLAVREAAIVAVMAFDVLALSALLALSGGPYNPFNFLYLVHIALAAVVLRSAWTWGLVGLSVACFGSLFLLKTGGSHAGHSPEHMRMHLQGMYVAFVVAAGFITYFVSRVTTSLARRETELEKARAAAARDARLSALATLAGGAAHELATPLSTIAVVARELERELERSPATQLAVGDAQLIRREVERCRDILHRMAADAGQGAGESFTAAVLPDLIAAVLAHAGAGDRTRVEMTAAAAKARVAVSLRTAIRAIRGIIDNALQASSGNEPVTVRIAADDATCRIEIQDSGAGMPADVLLRVGEPFFTTKEPGNGMGLGVFLARAVLERLGGGLEFTSMVGRGTTARLWLPRVAVAPAVSPESPRGEAA